MRKQLPIGRPYIFSYKNYALALSMLAPHEASMPWILNRYLQLYTKTEMDEDVHWLQFCLVEQRSMHFSNNPWYGLHILNEDDVRQMEDVPAFIVDCLQQHCYVELKCDQFYLPHTYAYGNSHRMSNVLIYGYDLEQRTFDVLDFAYTTTGQLDSVSLKMENLILHIEDYVPSNPVKLLKMKPVDAIPFDLELCIQLLEDYIHSYPTADRNLQMERPHDRAAYGRSIYERLEHYMELLSLQQIRMNLLPFCVLYDHKKCLVGLIRYLVQQGMVPEDLLEPMLAIEKKAFFVRNTMIKFELTSEFGLLPRVNSGLAEIKRNEEPVLDALLTALQRYVNVCNS